MSKLTDFMRSLYSKAQAQGPYEMALPYYVAAEVVHELGGAIEAVDNQLRKDIEGRFVTKGALDNTAHKVAAVEQRVLNLEAAAQPGQALAGRVDTVEGSIENHRLSIATLMNRLSVVEQVSRDTKAKLDAAMSTKINGVTIERRLARDAEIKARKEAERKDEEAAHHPYAKCPGYSYKVSMIDESRPGWVYGGMGNPAPGYLAILRGITLARKYDRIYIGKPGTDLGMTLAQVGKTGMHRVYQINTDGTDTWLAAFGSTADAEKFINAKL